MDKLIKDANYCHDDESKRENFEEIAGDWRGENSDKASSKDVNAAFTALLSKFSTPANRPKHETEGWEQAKYALRVIRDLAHDVIERDKKELSAIRQIFLTFCVKILQCGYTMLHMDMVEEIVTDNRTDFEDYCKTLKKEALNPLMEAVYRKPTAEEGVDPEDFWEEFNRLTDRIVDRILTDEQKAEFGPFLHDFANDLEFGAIFMDEDVCKKMCSTATDIKRSIEDIYGFETIEDYKKVNEYLKRCGEIVVRPDFVPHEYGASRFSDCVCVLKVFRERGVLKPLYQSVFDLILQINKCTYSDDKYVIGLYYDAYRFFRDFPEEFLQPDPALFKDMVKNYTKVVEQVDIKFLQSEKFASDVLDDVIIKIYGSNKTVTREWVSLAATLMKRPTDDTMQACRTVFDEDKGWTWKNYEDIAAQIFDSWLHFEPPTLSEDESKEVKETLSSFKSAGKAFLEGMKKAKLLKNHTKTMIDTVTHYLRYDHNTLLDFAEDIAEHVEINTKTDKPLVIDAMRKVNVELKNKERDWNDNWDLQRAAEDLIESTMEPYKDAKSFTDEDLDVFFMTCETCLEFDCVDQNTGRCPSTYLSVYLKISGTLFKWLTALRKTHLATRLVPGLLKVLETDDDDARRIVGVQLRSLLGPPSAGQSSDFTSTLAPHLDQFLQIYLETESEYLLEPIKLVYPSNTQAMTKHFRDVLEKMTDSGNPSLVTSLAMLLEIIATKQPELFTKEDIKTLVVQASEQPQSQHQLLNVIGELAKRQPDQVCGAAEPFFDLRKWDQYAVFNIMGILNTLSLHDEKVASRVMNLLLGYMKSTEDRNAQMVCLNYVRTVGFRNPDLLKQKRSEVENFKSSDPDILTMKQAVVDLIDGKTPEATIAQMEDQQKELLALAGRVEQVTLDVTELKVDAERKGKEIKTLSTELSAQGSRVGQVEKGLEETNVLVEQIDQKTLSHAPFWARDMSKLMNVAGDADWRLLGSRLGYSNDDLRAWAQQADPCMAMLNEWYATRKTSEATYAVLTQLQEMNRVDASIIVENAMKNAEKIVEDDEEFEYASPPAVFISYQWGHQPEVMLLQRHLEMAGYRCWLDIGQMGGGDKLFEKIDTGIRAAKVVICCVTEKYASSPNCNREVNLSVNLKKAMIPLLLERCAWPPPGSMGPIFSEYLFIRLFKRPGEDAGLPEDERFWPRDKFNELLMQLSVLGVTPDLTEIHADYRDWWMPVVKEIKIDKSKTKNNENKASTKTAENRSENAKEPESPEVFISYQWGKQTSIIRLYEHLTMEGYSCWLDIKQMGGGDSLFDKIDRGIRGCKVVVCCVTSKYALSVNCRREVGLSVALNKPIIPILLEEMAWPPTGPIGVVLAPLLYLDFRKSVGNETVWEGESFKGLLEKIISHVPRETPSNPTTAVSNTTAQKKAESNKAKSPQSQNASSKSTPQRQQPQDSKVVAPTKDNNTTTSSTNPEGEKVTNPGSLETSPKSNLDATPEQKGASRNSAPEPTPESPSSSKSKSCVVL